MSLINELNDGEALRRFLAPIGDVSSTDQTGGLRVVLANLRIVHFRPSGNAPEFRVYAEAESEAAAADLLREGMSLVKARLVA